MKRCAMVLLQVVIVIIGMGAFTFLLWEPHVEGRNANATVFAIYFKDPFLAYVYLASILFFGGLYQAFKVLGYVRGNQGFSQVTLNALRNIKYCALGIIGFVVVSVVFIPFGDPDDVPPGVALRTLVILGAILVASGAVLLERFVKKQCK